MKSNKKIGDNSLQAARLQLKAAPGFTLIEILVVIGMIAILATVVLIAINPARQFRQGRDSQRLSNVNAILNGIGQYVADHKGLLPTAIKPEMTEAQNLCTDLVPTYIPSMPVDPSVSAGPIKDCASPYATNYHVAKDVNGRITVGANGEEPAGLDNISVTR